MIVSFALLFCFGFSPASAQTPNEPDVNPSEKISEWLTYVDPRFDFTVEYPAAWSTRPRDDEPGYVGGTLVFSKSEIDSTFQCDEGAPLRIELGLYLSEYTPSSTLAEWSEKRDQANAAFPADQIRITNAYTGEIGGKEAYYKEGVSPLTEFAYFNVLHDKTVWFVWMNSADEQNKELLQQVVESLEFGSDTPNTLQEAYGKEFQPAPLQQQVENLTQTFIPSTSAFEVWEADEGYPIFSTRNVVVVNTRQKKTSQPLLPVSRGLTSIASNYIVPVSVTATILCGNLNAPVCNGTHKGQAANAVDMSMSAGTSVRNSARSIKNSAGWDSSGYGNLVTMYDSSNNHVAYYAHLSSINHTNLNSTQPVSQGVQIGLSGCTGNCGGNHLHFHVRTGSSAGNQPVALGSMPGLTINSSYPNCGKSAGNCPGGFQCTCGQAN